MPNEPLKIKRGVTFKARITTVLAGVPANLTGKVLIFYVYQMDGNDKAKNVFALQIDSETDVNKSRFYFADAASGITRVKLSNEDTPKLTAGRAFWWIGLAENGDVDEIAAGRITVSNP